jgi:hypothetical protein
VGRGDLGILLQELKTVWALPAMRRRGAHRARVRRSGAGRRSCRVSSAIDSAGKGLKVAVVAVVSADRSTTR